MLRGAGSLAKPDPHMHGEGLVSGLYSPRNLLSVHEYIYTQQTLWPHFKPQEIVQQ